MTKPTLGAVLREMRERKKMSLRDLEIASGVLLGVIGKIERGDVESPGLLPVAKMCAGLGVTPNDVLIAAGMLSPPDAYRSPELDPPATRRDIEMLRAEIDALRAEVRRAIQA